MDGRRSDIIFKLMFVGSILYGHLAIPLFWIGSKYLATTAQKWMQVEFTSTPGDDSIEPRKFDPQDWWDWKDCICLRTFCLTFLVNRSKLPGSYGIPSVVHSRSLRTCLYVPCVSFQYPSWENQSNVRKDDPIDEDASRTDLQGHDELSTWYKVFFFSSSAYTSQTKIEQTTGWYLSKTANDNACQRWWKENMTLNITIMLQQPKVQVASTDISTRDPIISSIKIYEAYPSWLN